MQATLPEHGTPNRHQKADGVVFAQIGKFTDKGAKMAYHINKRWPRRLRRYDGARGIKSRTHDSNSLRDGMNTDDFPLCVVHRKDKAFRQSLGKSGDVYPLSHRGQR